MSSDTVFSFDFGRPPEARTPRRWNPCAVDRVRQIIVPVDDVAAATDHYTEELGLRVRFIDGDRWAALELNGLALALAGPAEQPAGGQIALGVKVTDIDAALARFSREGGAIVTPPYEGDHERRACVRDRFGTLLALYEPLPSPA
jgi:predicted enzyme related to lactoylglutathione lyase